MKRLLFAVFGIIFFAAISTLDDTFVPQAEAGVLTHGQSISVRLHQRPKLQPVQRYDSSSKVISKTNPKLKSKDSDLAPEKQIQAQQNAEEEWRKKYAKWREKSTKIQARAIEKEKKEQEDRVKKAKKLKEAEDRKLKKADSVREAPLNPSSVDKKPKESSTLDLKKESTESKPKDTTRRVPLLKQLWHAIFG